MSGGQRYFEDTHGMSHEDWKFHAKGKEVNDDMPGHELMSKRMIHAHFESLTEDKRLRYIEQLLYIRPPQSVIESFMETRWRAERIYDLVYNGVIPEEKEADQC